MVAMVAANNAAFFAVLFLETTFVDLFVVCNNNNRIKRNHTSSVLRSFFFLLLLLLRRKEGGVFQMSQRGDKGPKIFPIQSNPIGYFFLSPARSIFSAQRRNRISHFSLSLRVFRGEFNECSAIKKAGMILRRGKGRIRSTRTEERERHLIQKLPPVTSSRGKFSSLNTRSLSVEKSARALGQNRAKSVVKKKSSLRRRRRDARTKNAPCWRSRRPCSRWQRWKTFFFLCVL